MPLPTTRWTEGCGGTRRHAAARLVEARGLAHGRLEVEHLDVLPVLLEQRHEEVDGELGVLEDGRALHAAVADGDVEAEHLLELELDGGLHSSTLADSSSDCCTRVGNLPALLRP